MISTAEFVSVHQRLSWHASRYPDKDALIFLSANGSERRVSYAELDCWSNQIARLLASRGTGEGTTVAIGLPNSIEHVACSFAAWKLGAMSLPVAAAMPVLERDAVLDLAGPVVVISEWTDSSWPNLTVADLGQSTSLDESPLPEKVANPGRAMVSGGSTGRPKLIVRRGPWGFPIGGPSRLLSTLKVAPEKLWLVPGPLHHEGPFLATHLNLFESGTTILLERFDAEIVVDVIERYKPYGTTVTPTMLQRLADLPGIDQRDLSSLEAVGHTGSPCPAWLKRRWIELVGAENVCEAYGGTEGNGYVMIGGVDWLAHPGSVGTPVVAEVKIVDDAGAELPRGEVGRVFSRSLASADLPFMYIGSPPPETDDDGFTWIGDLGWMDEDGFLYIADRRTDLIISGGANVRTDLNIGGGAIVFASEVEAAFSEHPGVADVAVVGIPDEAWGKRVHAIVQPHNASMPPESDLDAWCRNRISVYKCPKTYEFVAELPRTDAGKIRRSALVDARSGGTARLLTH